jgi:PAS domain-containing protein
MSVICFMDELVGRRPDGRLQVTASALVRHFGEWQERAARTPVYVLHHGRPRLVLLGVDLLDRAAVDEPAVMPPPPPLLTAVLDGIDLPLLLLDQRGEMGIANAAARARFGDQVATGRALVALSSRDGGALAAAIHRVLDGAGAQRVALVADRFPERLLRIVVEPLPEGCLVRIEDASAEREARIAVAERDAIVAAVEATGLAAIARVSLRGYLTAPRPALAALLRRPVEELAGARFLTLVDPADRPALGESLELASGGSETAARPARLLTGNGEALATRVGFWPMRVGGRVEEVVAALAAAAA